MKELNMKKFAVAINEKLNGTSLRKAAIEIGIGHSILHRTSNGAIPDANNLIKILDWLGKDLKDFE